MKMVGKLNVTQTTGWLAGRVRMSNRLTASIVVLFFIATKGLHAQVDTSAASFFPLHIGDYWEYIFINNPPLEPSELFWYKVVGDTTMPNGKRYYKKLYGSYLYAWEEFVEFVRMDDSLNVYVYNTRAVECPDSEHVMFRLNAPDGSLWPVCANIAPGGANHMWVQGTYNWYYQYLGLWLSTKGFCPSKIDTITGDTTYCTLAATFTG